MRVSAPLFLRLLASYAIWAIPPPKALVLAMTKLIGHSSLFLCYRTDAKADADPEISLINESSAVREESDAGCACRGHELLQCGAEEIFESDLRLGNVRS